MTPPSTSKQSPAADAPRTAAERSLSKAREALRRVDVRIAARRQRLNQAAKTRA